MITTVHTHTQSLTFSMALCFFARSTHHVSIPVNHLLVMWCCGVRATGVNYAINHPSSAVFTTHKATGKTAQPPQQFYSSFLYFVTPNSRLSFSDSPSPSVLISGSKLTPTNDLHLHSCWFGDVVITVTGMQTYALKHHTMHSCKLANEGTRPCW